MKIPFAIVCTMLSALSVVAQNTKSYTVSDSDANRYKRSVLYLEPINFLPLGVPGFTPGIKGETFVGERVMVWGQVKYTLLDMHWLEHPADAAIDVNGHKSQVSMEGGGAFFAINATRSKNLKVITGRDMGAVYTRIYRYIRVPSRIKYMLGVRGGYQWQRRMLSLDNEPAQKMYTYKTMSGTAIPTMVDLYTTAYTSSLFAGLHFRKVTNTRIYMGERLRANSLVTDLFADVVLPGNSSVSNVRDDYFGVVQVTPKSYAMVDMGWRCGIAERPSKGRLFQASIVFGQRRGPATDNGYGFYLLGNVGFVLGSNKYIGGRS